MARLFGRLRRRRVYQPALPGIGPPPRGTRRRRRRASGPFQTLAEPVPRRRFLASSLGWVTASIATALGIPGVVAAVSPAFRTKKREWSPVGRLGKPAAGEPDLTIEGKPLLTSFKSLVQDAYMKAEPQNIPVFVVNRGNGEFSVYDVRCTHLGCPVSFEEKKGKFFSPCHNGIFDKEGRVLGGPPPRPLDRYEWKVEGGVLYAGALYRVNEKLERTT